MVRIWRYTSGCPHVVVLMINDWKNHHKGISCKIQAEIEQKLKSVREKVEQEIQQSRRVEGAVTVAAADTR